MDGHAYKRRKLNGNSVALLSEENASSRNLNSYRSKLTFSDNQVRGNKDNLGASAVVNVIDCSVDPLNNGNLLISGHHCLHKRATVFNSLLESIPSNMPDNICFMGEDKVPFKASNVYFGNSATVHTMNVKGSCSTSEGNMEHGSTSTNTETEAEDCVVSSDLGKRPIRDFTSSKELCIFVLQGHRLLRGECNLSAHHSELLCSNDDNSSQPCKICGKLGNPLEMLICDLCEEAFHLSCCNPRVKELPIDDWYCQLCSRKPKPLLQTFNGKLINVKAAQSDHGRHCYGDLISLMLQDNQPYTTGVRIGMDFQVDVPVWSGPISLDHDYFGELSEMDPIKFTLNAWSFKKSNFIGNWIQCREVVNSDENSQEIICGKWRRAPLFLLQTEDWDCSCAVTWDPVHADCAVSQELTTDEVIQQLKYVEKVRNRLATEKKKLP